MTLPVLDKTWQFNVNNVLRTTGTALGDNQKLLRAVKNAMIGFGLGAWTVRGSSDAATFGLDNVDRWTTDAKLVWANAGVNHSWIVLKNTALGANVELCLDLRSTVPSRIDAVMSFGSAFGAGGGSGGSLTARPTSTDEVVVNGGAAGGWDYHGLGANTTFDCTWHVLHSTDGQATRIFYCRYTNVCAMWANFDKVKNAPGGWAVPAIGCLGSGDPLFSSLNDNAYQVGRMSTGPMSLYCTSEGIFGCYLVPPSSTGAMLGETDYSYNDISNEWAITPVGVASQTPNARGRHGTLYDLGWGSIYRQPGDTWPNDNTRQFIQVGHLVVPWNGSIPQFGL
jgi:hypothetical protein